MNFFFGPQAEVQLVLNREKFELRGEFGSSSSNSKVFFIVIESFKETPHILFNSFNNFSTGNSLSRDIYQDNVYKKSSDGKLPIKWLALESMTYQMYTSQSDV